MQNVELLFGRAAAIKGDIAASERSSLVTLKRTVLHALWCLQRLLLTRTELLYVYCRFVDSQQLYNSCSPHCLS
jgi:hypothetical protein